jgi:hypothetical protein
MKLRLIVAILLCGLCVCVVAALGRTPSLNVGQYPLFHHIDTEHDGDLEEHELFKVLHRCPC